MANNLVYTILIRRHTGKTVTDNHTLNAITCCHIGNNTTKSSLVSNLGSIDNKLLLRLLGFRFRLRFLGRVTGCRLEVYTFIITAHRKDEQ